jgi:hypothetical protein
MNAVIELVTLTTGTLTVDNQPDTEAVLRSPFFFFLVFDLGRYIDGKRAGKTL